MAGLNWARPSPACCVFHEGAMLDVWLKLQHWGLVLSLPGASCMQTVLLGSGTARVVPGDVFAKLMFLINNLWWWSTGEVSSGLVKHSELTRNPCGHD